MGTETPLAPGVHLVYKPPGPSSHAVVEGLRVGRGKLCHGGALDPFAEGLLLVLAGGATRLFPYLHGVPKGYEGEIVWGSETDNGDAGGVVIARGDPQRLVPETLEAALAPFRGWHDQVPPATSNKRVDGERAYLRAQRGEDVVLPPSRVLLAEVGWTRHELPHRSWLRVSVAGGFYVRALVRDLGRATGACAHLAALRRTHIGPWSAPVPGIAQRIQGEAMLPWCPARRLTASEVGALAVGVELPHGALRAPNFPLPPAFPEPPVVLLHEGRLRGLATGDRDPLTVRWVTERGL